MKKVLLHYLNGMEKSKVSSDYKKRVPFSFVVSLILKINLKHCSVKSQIY